MSTPRPRKPLDDFDSGPSADRELFDDEDDAATLASPALPHRPFPDYIRTTPAAPLSSAEKALLWVAGVAVALLFAASLYKTLG